MEEQRTALLLQLAFALGAAGHPRESRDTLHAVLGQLAGNRPDRRVEAVTFCALMERRLSRHDEARALLLAELAALNDQDTAAAAALKFELGSGELAAGHPAAAGAGAGGAPHPSGGSAPAARCGARAAGEDGRSPAMSAAPSPRHRRRIAARRHARRQLERHPRPRCWSAG
jgi:hypothetical protein